MSEKKVLSVAEIARRLDVPESTVHYWKNRFSQHLPSVGVGRQKRFKPEAVEVFATISQMLSAGHPAGEIMETLTNSYPLTPATMDESSPAPINHGSMESALQMAQAMGGEIARSISEHFGKLMDPDMAQSQQDVIQMREEIDRTNALISAQYEELEILREQNQTLKEKMDLMEKELVRLRKDRREMEKYLLDKIKRMAS